MRAKPACAWPVLGLFLLACSNSGIGRVPELAAATIGPAGGELRIDSGPLNGFVLTVPPGALAVETPLRIVRTGEVPLPQVPSAVVTVTEPGVPFVLEPRGVQFATHATMRLPYAPEILYYRTGLGNVRVRQQSLTATWDREPQVVDVANRFVETRLLTGGIFQVVTGPHTATLGEYFPAQDSVTQLEGGASFHCEPFVDARIGGRTVQRWRYELVPNQRHAAWLFELGVFVGRESVTEDWLELWSAQAPQPEQIAHLVYGYQFGPWMTSSVYRPRAMSLPVGATVRLRTAWRFREPIEIAGTRYLDVLELRVDAEWDRGDLLPGHEELVFTFAPGVGLLQLQDGANVYRRAP